MSKMLAADLINYRVVEVEIPKVRPKDILVKLKAAWGPGAEGLREKKVPGVKAYRGLERHPELLPLAAGEVVEVGTRVEKIEVGMRITFDPCPPPCGRCHFCRISEPMFCTTDHKIKPQGIAEYLLIPELLQCGIIKLPDTVSYEEAAFTDCAACVINGVREANLEIGDSIAIIGAGPLGLTWVQMAKIAGATKIISIDLYDVRLKIASDLGATHVINIRESDSKEGVFNLTHQHGADVVAEVVGNITTYRKAFDLVRCAGTIVLFGGIHYPPFDVCLDLSRHVHYKRLKVIGSWHYYPDMIEIAVNLMATGQLNIKSYITKRIALERISELKDILRGPDYLATVITN